MTNSLFIEILVLAVAIFAIFLLKKIGDKNIRKDISVSTILMEILQISKENKDISMSVDEIIEICLKRVTLNEKINEKELREIIDEVKKHIQYTIEK